MNPGVGPPAAVYMEMTAPSCLPPITGQEEHFAQVPYLPFVGAQFPPETLALSSKSLFKPTTKPL